MPLTEELPPPPGDATASHAESSEIPKLDPAPSVDSGVHAGAPHNEGVEHPSTASQDSAKPRLRLRKQPRKQPDAEPAANSLEDAADDATLDPDGSFKETGSPGTDESGESAAPSPASETTELTAAPPPRVPIRMRPRRIVSEDPNPSLDTTPLLEPECPPDEPEAMDDRSSDPLAEPPSPASVEPPSATPVPPPIPRKPIPRGERPKVVISTAPARPSEYAGEGEMPPPISIDTLRPSPSLKPPPPANAPVKQKVARKAGGLRRWITGIGALAIAAMATGAYLHFSDTGLQGLSPKQTPPTARHPVEAPGERVAVPSAEPASAVTDSVTGDRGTASANLSVLPVEAQPELSGALPGPDINPAIVRVVNGLEISMARNSGAASMIVIGGVVFRSGTIVIPEHELRFAGFTPDGSRLLFIDSAGARYEKAY